ncbi:probable cytochrome P450 303a1 [Chrysoperla carnea]|uniref:probable cytochrome P450 303a1 n=1 Tax=Chrysoperla carnea TaxID=189513 RepID=UPI001D07B78B|nr:probable cytochrome P450 303a1 [Chrysoperla carnea]
MWLVIILFFVILVLLYIDTLKPKNFPPGPKWLPLLGNILLIHRLRKQNGFLYKVIAKMAQKDGIVGLKIGKDKIVIGYSPEAVKAIHKSEDLQGRPHGPFYQTRTWGLRRGLLLTDGEFWSEQRRFALRQLHEFGYGSRNMSSLVEDECAQLMKDVKEKLAESNKNQAVLQMDTFFGVYVLNTLWTMMASIRYNADDKELGLLQNLLNDLFENIDMVGSLFSQFPILQYVAPESSGYNFFIEIHKNIWKFIRNEIENHKNTYKDGHIRDFIDAYLEVLQSEDKRSSFSELQLVAVCMDFFIAGSETTSKTLGFGFLYLLLNPDVQRKAQEEIDRVVGPDRMPQLSDRDQMPYMNAFVLESVRMFMFRAFGVPHRALRDTKLLGYDIPKDTMVLANFYGVLRDWEDPDAFRPERFIENGKVVTPDLFIPFGFGKHRCVGESLAKANIFLFSASLLQKFNFSVVPGTKPPSTSGVDSCTPSTGPFKALVTYRNQNLAA